MGFGLAMLFTRQMNISESLITKGIETIPLFTNILLS
jgi:hypothetical protein